MLLKLFKTSYSGLSKPIWLLAAVTFINRAGAMVLPFMSLYLVNALGFDLIQAGIVMTFYGIGSLIGNYIGGKLTDHFGTYWVQAGSLFFGGLIYMSLILVTSFEWVCFMFMMTSMVNDIFRPASMASIALYSKPENRTRSVGLIRLAINLGFSAGPAFGGILIGIVGYKYLFLLDGLTCLLACIFFLLKMENRDGKLSSLRKKTKTNVQSAIHDKEFVFFLFMVVLTGIVFMQLFYTIPLYLEQEILLSTREIGVLMALNGLLIAISEMPILQLLTHYKRTIKLMALGAFMMSLSFVFLFSSYQYWAIVVFFLLITYGEIFNFPYATTWALSRSSEHNRGSYMGIYGMGFSIAAILGPYIGTKTVDALGWSTWWCICAMMMFLVTIGLFFLEKISESHKD